MATILVEGKLKNVVMRRILIVSTIIILLPSVFIITSNIYVGAFMMLLFAAVFYITVNQHKYVLTSDGVYICDKKHNTLYGYKYENIDSIDFIDNGTEYNESQCAIIIFNNNNCDGVKYKHKDMKKIVVPASIENLDEFINTLNRHVKDKYSDNYKTYLTTRNLTKF